MSKHAFQLQRPNAETDEEGSGSSSSNKTPGVYLKDRLEETSTTGRLERRRKQLKHEVETVHPELTGGLSPGERKRDGAASPDPPARTGQEEGPNPC